MLFAGALLLGLCLGSFAGALAHRLPLGIPIGKKSRSACPACGHKLALKDLVPVFSWAALKGKCGYCRTAISPRYPLIELGTAALCGAFYLVYGRQWQVFALFALAPALAALIDIDLRHKLIPDALNVWIAACGAAALALWGPEAGDIFWALSGAALYAGGAFLLRLVFLRILRREALGLGDVKFFGAAGLWLGLEPEAAALFLALAGAFGIALALFWRRLTGDREFPFGPALACAFAAALLVFAPFS
jgi:leader peptidase (prepilin peptidase)/N-methyltransferase